MSATRKNRGQRMPQLRQHRVRKSHYAYATFGGVKVRYGNIDGTEDRKRAEQRFAEDLARWLANGRRFPEHEQDGADPTVAALGQLYLEHLEDEHGGAWSANNRVRYEQAVEAAVALFGSESAGEFGPLALKMVRTHLVEATDRKGHPRFTRRTINERIRYVVDMFRWAVAEERIPATRLEALRAVKPLRRGRPGVRESRAVEPIEREAVEAVLPHLLAPVAAIVELMWWTGARPSEITGLRPCDLDRDGDVWTAQLGSHKTSTKGKLRRLHFGPQAQAVLKPFLLRPTDRPMFRPVEAVAEMNARKRRERRTPLYASHAARYDRERAERPDQPLGETYDSAAIRRAVGRGIARANREREAEGLAPIPTWTPYQLRHSAATRIRREAGLEASRVILGHSSMATTETYAEIDWQAAEGVARQLG